MKRIIASVALVMSTFAVCAAQEMNLNIYSRLDANKAWPLESTSLSNNRINWGNSSLYLMTDGSISEKLSFDVSMNFLNSDPVSLYTNTGSCVETNWLNWADFTYSLSDKWSISAGKQIMLAGGWEIDMYDHEQHLDLCSMDWQLINVYQWGGKVSFAPSEDHTFAVQVSSSPLRDYLFKDKEIAASFQTRNTAGAYSNIFSANYIQTPFEECPSLFMAGIGNMVETDNLSAFVDLMFKTPGNADFGSLNTSLTGSLAYSLCDGALELGAKAGYETISASCPDFFGYSGFWCADELEGDGVSGIVPLGISPVKDYAFGGLFVHYYPIEDLRIHAAVACNNYTKGVSATIGVLYTLGTKLF